MPKHRSSNRRARCPICKALITARMLSWHIEKRHDEGTPAALDPTIATRPT